MMPKGFSLSIKLILAFLLLAVLVAGVGSYQIRGIQHFHDLFADLVDNDIQRRSILREIRITVGEIENAALQRVLADAGAPAADTVAYREEIDVYIQNVDNGILEYQALAVDQAGEGVDAQTLKKMSDTTKAIGERAVSLVDLSRDSSAQLAIFDAGVKAFIADIDALDTLTSAAIATEQEAITSENAGIDRTVSNLLTGNVILVVLTVVVALIVGLFMANRITRSVRKVKEGAERVGAGDFSSPIKIAAHDEIGQLGTAFNAMAERLRESYARLAIESQRDETLLESMSDGLIAVDAKGQVVLVNNQAVTLLDLGKRSILLGTFIERLITLYTQEDKPLPAGYHPIKQAFDTAKQLDGVYTYHRQDAKKLLVSISMSPVILDGRTTGVVMIIRDVTHEKEVDRMKTEFISLASHQLRTPLSAIKWFSEMLLSGDAGKLTPEQAEFAQNVADSTERMIELVNSLLNISRIESGRIIVDPKPTDLSELVSGIVNDLKAKTAERQQTLIVSVHKELPKVSLDAHLVGQVYLNLLTNAIKYTPKGGEISVFVSRNGDQLVSQITDNGYGIPKDDQPKLFQKFFRAANITKIETDGTGLGLYLIKAIVESSGGKIWYHSEEGKGTTFWFSLPMSGMKAQEGEVTLDV